MQILSTENKTGECYSNTNIQNLQAVYMQIADVNTFLHTGSSAFPSRTLCFD